MPYRLGTAKRKHFEGEAKEQSTIRLFSLNAKHLMKNNIDRQGPAADSLLL